MSEMQVNIRKIKSLKYILDLNSSKLDFTLEYLQKKADKLCFKNFADLITIHYYLFQTTNCIKSSINSIKAVKNEPCLYKKYYIDYLKNIRNNKEFKDYQLYIIVHRSMEVRKNSLPAKRKDNLYIENALNKYKQVQFSLLFNILGEKFRPHDIMENLPQLAIWVEENENKPIKGLTDDECEIIAGLFYGFDYNKMLNLNLSSDVNSTEQIKKILNNIPQKFHVQNITQSVFRVILKEPDIWNVSSHEKIIKIIKNIGRLKNE
ncbi:hypothetical protein IJ707_05520 [bacterium]|nr:hypothetical protein [bacterium]